MTAARRTQVILVGTASEIEADTPLSGGRARRVSGELRSCARRPVGHWG